MKIIHINLSKSWRGGERQTALLMNEIKQRNIEQLLICRKKSVLENFCIDNELRYCSYSKNIFALLIMSYVLKRIAKKENFAIVNCHESGGHTLALLSKILWRAPFKIIVNRRVIFPVKKKLSSRIKYSEKYIAKIICESKAVESVIHTSANYYSTTVISSMVNTNRCIINKNILKNRYNINTDTYKIIGYIAALTFEKDHITFLKTAKKILETNPKTIFLIIGEGKLKNKIINQTKELKLSNHVKFLGFIKNVENIIPEIDILLFTSISEGLGTTILDFFVAEKPVVCVKNGGSEEIVLNEKTGFICEKGDYIALAEKTILLLNNNNEKLRITKYAKTFVEENFSIVTITSKTLKVYNDVLQK